MSDTAVTEPVKERGPVATNIIAVLNSQYGPIAFGLVALLVIWWQIVGPELSAAREDRKSMQGVADTVKLAVDGAKEAALASKEAVSTANDTAETNERTSENLENVSEQLKETAETLKKP